MAGTTSAVRLVSPFARLNDRLAGIPPGRPPILLGLGEPQHAIPDFVGPTIAAHLSEFGQYPAIRGTDAFRRTIADWLGHRYSLVHAIDPERMVLPLNGSREGLFFAALGARERTRRIERPIVLLPNPFYQAYAAGAEAAGAEIVLVEPDGERTLPDLATLGEDILARTVAIYVASPSNPQGSVATLGEWKRLIGTARQYDIMILADECYSEIYRTAPPPGVLEAADSLGDGYGNVLTFHSLSKRSNLPGLRCGFAAGDPGFIAGWTRLRNMAAPQVPGPLQAVAVAAYSDESHVAANRALYNEKFALAEAILGDRLGGGVPQGGFFLWLPVPDGEAAAVRLWQEGGVRTIPGGYLCLPDSEGHNPGVGYLRIAMVQDLDVTREALTRMADIFDRS
ncbi:aspartate aminotransferase [Kaistia algarum]|uniref:aminotransferase class I/II-fold pyridoxal phosphate-dependent enzyme n=1 Tax=Kaistia algarum TaxID=2083279 RepID=UPI000CE84EA1|nr:aminotransferase class I/II-fold pyridoxal phosphate-dependent enzyme [Kaistia algarum]MCX5514037.1 aminotransferase class I/II-fold pyridoxal phosphate-dependent enzyme [Kaistia algarum]PPE77793.1 aspartate aminotransferase [Kaistia algarum]